MSKSTLLGWREVGSGSAVKLGACFVERHITLESTMCWFGQAFSEEPGGFASLVRDICVIEKPRGDGVKRICKNELPISQKLCRSLFSENKGDVKRAFFA